MASRPLSSKNGKSQRNKAVIHERCRLAKISRCVDLSGLKLYALPQCLLSLGSCLEYLYLHNCNIQGDFPCSLLQLTRLKTLDLSENNITVIPDVFLMAAKYLEVLDLSYNDITRVPATIEELSSLRELNLAYNKIIYFPTEAKNLPRLQEVKLNNNCLLGLSETLFDNESPILWRKLDISFNLLTELPVSIGNLQQLTHLDVRGNELKYLPSTVKLLATVESFKYGQNCWYESIHNYDGGKAYGVKALIVLSALSL